MRRRRPEKRTILHDPIYNDLVVAKFINYLISIFQRLFFEVCLRLKKCSLLPTNSLITLKILS